MNRNSYDGDVTTWSPQGRLFQVDYAMEAVKQGPATIGLRSETHAVLVSLTRSSSELASHLQKFRRIDDHVGISYSGLMSDARLLGKFMRTESLNFRWSLSEPVPIGYLVNTVGQKLQKPTQMYGSRPYGVGILVAGYDRDGPHIFQTCPSANYYECKAMAIGARSQSARTYLEKHFKTFPDCEPDQLIRHGLRALRDCLRNEAELSTLNCSVAIVGKDVPFTIYANESVKPYLDSIDETGPTAAAAPAAAADAPAAEGAGAPEEAMES
ncbi:proteasome subunit alpha type-1-like [Sycon ciliatum]|uniref:proteasome subunit alpha type-1-like n=1 Tax=Sycon ciliatum TaxID=27933 RepID=UPI0020ABD9D4|eukprot:scpid82082/ scgid9946/ Proteasome subunit alpha type-1; Macropain subunit C2; Multicatalytic endopeptidase complex subunit C2; Proteasome component C2; Proteasome nu chain